jgi:hypothetical protein
MAGFDLSSLIGIPSMGRAIEQHTNRFCTNQIPDVGTLTTAYRRGGLSEDQFRRGLKASGYSDTAIDAMILASKPMLSPAEITEAQQKGYITPEKAKAMLEQHGYDPETANQIIDMDKSIISPDEALYLFRQGKINEEEYKKDLKANGYGQTYIDNALDINKFHFEPSTQAAIDKRNKIPDEALRAIGVSTVPTAEFIASCKARGMTEQQAKELWISNQPIPDANTIATLLHRGEISEQTARDLLKGTGMSDAAIALALAAKESIIPARTAGTMYKAGTITEDQLYEQFIKAGYSPEQADMAVAYYKQVKATADAKAAAAAAKKAKAATDKASSGGGGKGSTAKNKDITVGLIKQAWEYQEIDEAEAYQLLISLNYEDWEAALEMAVWKGAQEVEDRKDKETLAIAQFKAGVLDEAGLRNALGELNLKATAIETIMIKNVPHQKLTETLPSVAVLQKWLRKGVIDTETFMYYMQRHNYSYDVANIYLNEVIGSVTE